MEQHIGHIQQLVDQLSDIGHPISEFQIIAKLLGTLPAGYRNFISVWDSVPEEDQRLSLLILRLCKEQDLNANKLDTSGSDWTIPSSLPTWSSTSSVSSSYQSASTRKERKRNRTSSKDRCTCCDKHTSTCQNKERVRCLFCGRYGHQQADCNWHNTNLETEKDVVVVEDTPEIWKKGWRRIVLLFNFFSESGRGYLGPRRIGGALNTPFYPAPPFLPPSPDPRPLPPLPSSVSLPNAQPLRYGAAHGGDTGRF